MYFDRLQSVAEAPVSIVVKCFLQQRAKKKPKN